MKVKFSHVFLDDQKRPIKFKGKDGAVFKDIAIEALLHAASSDKEPDAREKRQRFDVAIKIKHFGDEAELSPEDCDLINRCVGTFHTLISGPASYLLEGKEIPEF